MFIPHTHTYFDLYFNARYFSPYCSKCVSHTYTALIHNCSYFHTYMRQGISQCRHKIFVKHFRHEDTDFHQNLTYLVIIFFSWYFRHFWEIKACCIFSDQLCICFKGFWKKRLCLVHIFVQKNLFLWNISVQQPRSTSKEHQCISCELFSCLRNYFRLLRTIFVWLRSISKAELKLY